MQPGPNPHGMVIEPNGDLIYNYEQGGLVRVNACGEVRWRLPLITHHAIFKDESGNLWVPGQTWTNDQDPALPGYNTERKDFFLAKVSTDGKVLKTWRLFDIIQKNSLQGLLYLGSSEDLSVEGVPDSLHFNDVDIFPASMTPGTFRPGDIMLSLRNINTILVIDPESLELRHLFVGPFVRQHDPDFVDGNTIRVFDNQTNTAGTPQESSRIIEISTVGSAPHILFKATPALPFFSYIMGKQQALPNGNILLAEAMRGRALEIDAAGNAVWEFRNLRSPGVAAVLSHAERLDPAMDGAFFERARAACAPSSAQTSAATSRKAA